MGDKPRIAVPGLVAELERNGVALVLGENKALRITGRTRPAPGLLKAVKLYQVEVKAYLYLRDRIRVAEALRLRIDDGGETELLSEYKVAVNCVIAIEHELLHFGHSINEVATMVDAALQTDRAGQHVPKRTPSSSIRGMVDQ